MSSTNHPVSPEPETEPVTVAGDTDDDPAHSNDEDEGWTSEGGATAAGPATDVEPDA